jgi:energy-converting hydrogenase Eha subunit H
MNSLIKLFFSMFIGVVAAGIAKLVHPEWDISALFMFGLVVFIVTLALALVIEK